MFWGCLRMWCGKNIRKRDIECLDRSLKLRQFTRANRFDHPINRIQKFCMEKTGYTETMVQEYAWCSCWYTCYANSKVNSPYNWVIFPLTYEISSRDLVKMRIFESGSHVHTKGPALVVQISPKLPVKYSRVQRNSEHFLTYLIYYYTICFNVSLCLLSNIT